MLTYVNEKTIHGVVYTALRESTNPTLQYIRRESDGAVVQCRLKTVWNDDAAIVALFGSV